MVLWSTLLAPVVLGDLVFKGAHANADVVLPDEASLATNPCLAGVIVLLGDAADAANELLSVLCVLPLLCFLRLLGLSAFGGGRGLEFVEWFRVLAFGGPDGAPRLSFGCVEVESVMLCMFWRMWCIMLRVHEVWLRKGSLLSFCAYQTLRRCAFFASVRYMVVDATWQPTLRSAVSI